MQFLSFVFILTLFFGLKCSAGDANVFYSDYISFVGQDRSGHVSFAIDDDRWQSGNGLELRVVHHKTIKWWFIGGYSLDIVSGRVKINGVEYPVYGLAELII